MNERPKTIFLDIDGTIVQHTGEITKQTSSELILLPGTIETLSEWDKKGYNIILTTGRRESTRKSTEEQLSKLGIFYDKLIMGIGGGARVIVNDLKDYSLDNTALAFNLKRNEGIKSIKNI